MYLLICSKYQLARFELIFNNLRCSYQALNLFDIEFIEEKITEVIHKINTYKQVIVSSELIAHKLIELFKQNSAIEYIAVGKGSANYLITNGLKHVVYPVNNSGIQAVIDNGLIKDDLPVMYLTCYKESYSTELSKINGLDIYSLYRHKNILEDSVKLKNIISNQELKGIIITSKKLALELFSIGAKLNLENELIKQSYIVIHDNIKNQLIRFGVSKIQLSTNISHIADLVGEK